MELLKKYAEHNNSSDGSVSSLSPDNRVHSLPYILISGVEGDMKTVSYELKKRGFIPKYALKQNNKHALVLTLSPKLHTKLAIQYNFPVRSMGNSSHADITRIVYRSHKIIERSGIKHGDIWVMHQPEKISMLGNTATDGLDLQALNDYFGSQISLYFAWLSFYSKFLITPALAGAVLFCHQLYTGHVDDPYSPYFMILIAVWSTVFLEYWKRRNSALAYSWGVYNADHEEQQKQIAKPNKLFRFAVTIPAIVIMILSLVRVMVYFIHLMDTANEIYGSSILGYWPTVVYSLLPVVAGFAYDLIVVQLNNYECHSTPAEKEHHLIIKQFAFQFVNRYCALIYVAFYLRDQERLRTLLASMLITNAIVDNILELFTPALVKLGLKHYGKLTNRSKDGPDTASICEGESLDPLVDNETANKNTNTINNRTWKSRVIKELERDEYNLRADYLELILQFGYVTMFAVVFPIAPALALLNNMMEAKVDFVKLSRSRRPPLTDRSTIGGWFTCLTILNFAAVLSNCFLLCIVSDNLNTVIPSDYESLFQSDQAKFILMVILEHSLLLLKMVLSSVIDDVPRWVQEKQAQEATRQRHALADERLALYSLHAQEGDIPPVLAASEEALERNVVAAKLSSEYSSPFGYNPLFLMGIVALPITLQSIGISPLYYLPLSLMYVSYLKADKDRQDRKAAIGIVSDVNILKYVAEEMPSWIKHSDVQRVQWLNDLLTKLWSSVSESTEAVIMETVQPILDSYKPGYISSLCFSRITLGTIAPVIVGIRNHRTEENCVRLDLELKWAGNPEVALEVGQKGFPLTIELSDIRISAILRVELTPLIPRFPCFGAITVTCMQKPFVDFSFKVGALDVMNIGAAEYNVAAAVNNIIRSILTTIALYPSKFVIPMVPDVDVKALTNISPVGLLHLRVISAKKLKVADLTSSDPFCEVRFMDTVQKTAVVKKSLNPVWNENFDIMVFDKETQFVELMIYDYDIGTASDFLGKVTVQLDSLPNFEVTELDLDLLETSTGTIQLECEYCPLKKSAAQKRDEKDAEQAKDVIFDFSPSALTSDILEAEVVDADIGDNPPNGKSLKRATTVQGVVNQVTGLKAAAASARANLQHSVSAVDSSATTEEYVKSPHRISKKLSPSKQSSFRGAGNRTGVLTISCIRGRNFKVHTMLSSSVRPYVIFSVGSVKKETAVQKDHHDPSFDESFNFVVHDPVNSVLIVKVMHDNRLRGDSILAELSMRLIDVANHKGPLDEEYLLTSRQGEDMYLACRMEWSESG